MDYTFNLDLFIVDRKLGFINLYIKRDYCLNYKRLFHLNIIMLKRELNIFIIMLIKFLHHIQSFNHRLLNFRKLHADGSIAFKLILGI